MKTALWAVGNTAFNYLKEGNQLYYKRIQHFIPFDFEIIPDVKNVKKLSEAQIKQKEGEQIIKKLQTSDYLILLDENGKNYDSINFANHLQNLFNRSPKRVVFLIGGAYGFSNDVYTRANEKLSLSKMTFSHQMIRLFFLEQYYRALTIQNNLPYHHA